MQEPMKVQASVTETTPLEPTPPSWRNWLVPVLLSTGFAMIAWGLFRLGQTWTMWSIVMVPHPIGLNYFKYTATTSTFWVLVPGLLLALGGFAFHNHRAWRWIPLILAILWLAAYPIIRPSTKWYYYWLIPKSK